MNSIRAERALSFSFLWAFLWPPGHSFKLSPSQMMVPKGLTAPFLAPLPSCARSVLVTQCLPSSGGSPRTCGGFLSCCAMERSEGNAGTPGPYLRKELTSMRFDLILFSMGPCVLFTCLSEKLQEIHSWAAFALSR